MRQKGSISANSTAQSLEQEIFDFAGKIMRYLLKDSIDIFESLFGTQTDWAYAPIFPLNTDGIDPRGSNVTIRNVTITNWDDAVAVKPANKGL